MDTNTAPIGRVKYVALDSYGKQHISVTLGPRVRLGFMWRLVKLAVSKSGIRIDRSHQVGIRKVGPDLWTISYKRPNKEKMLTVVIMPLKIAR